MLPTKEISEIELSVASEMNPGPWIKHSINTGIAARNIADKVKGYSFLSSNAERV